MIIVRLKSIIKASLTMSRADTATVRGLRERFQEVRDRIDQVAVRARRDPADITLIAISKTHSIEVIQELISLGAKDLGENRVQEAENKIAVLGQKARWHMVGHLQANKARKAVKLFDVIHSLDSIELSRRLNDICQQENKSALPVLIQVDLGKESTKTGVDQADLMQLAEEVRRSSNVKLIGLMTLPPFFDDPDHARPYFSKLRDLRDKLKSEGFFDNGPGELSMGMTNDFEVAIEEGATMVRVGTAIFGERGKNG
jgi:pyridoxal phosphate enzyme (YggS family)